MRRFRAFLHRYEREGREKMNEALGRDALAYARGVLAWIAMSDRVRAEKIITAHSWLRR